MSSIKFNKTMPWAKLWLVKGLEIKQDPTSPMLIVNGVKGFLCRGDIQTLLEVGRHIPQGGEYLEVGSWQGLSSILVANSLLLNANFSAKVHCVDTWQGSLEHQGMQILEEDQLFKTFKENISGAAVSSMITSHRKDSISAAKEFEDKSLDAVFIDGDHTEEGCLADLYAWLPKVKPGGLFFGHDAVPGKGVEKALNRFHSETGMTFQITSPPASHYIWVMHNS